MYTYALLGVAPCLSDAAYVTVTENQQPVAGTDANLTVCSGSAATALLPLLVGGQSGGTWTDPGGAAFGGSYDPLPHTPGVYTYTLVGAAPCVSDQSTVTVVEHAAPDAGADGTLTVCGDSPASVLFSQLTGADVGGAWAAPGGGAFSGTYDPLSDGPGVYTYTVKNGHGPRVADQSIVTVTENPVPAAGADASLTTGEDLGARLPWSRLLTGAQPGGVWTAPGGAVSNGTYDPALNAAGTYTYTVQRARSMHRRPKHGHGCGAHLPERGC